MTIDELEFLWEKARERDEADHPSEVPYAYKARAIFAEQFVPILFQIIKDAKHLQEHPYSFDAQKRFYASLQRLQDIPNT